MFTRAVSPRPSARSLRASSINFSIISASSGRLSKGTLGGDRPRGAGEVERNRTLAFAGRGDRDRSREVAREVAREVPGPVFHVSLLEPYCAWPGEEEAKPGPVIIDGEDEWEVESILIKQGIGQGV